MQGSRTHFAKLTIAHSAKKGFKKLMGKLLASPVTNPIENLLPSLKYVPENGKQYSCKHLWKQTTAKLKQ